MQTSLSAKTDGSSSAWTPFRYVTFTVLWAAAVFANVGSWMQNAAAGWLMTGLNPDPFQVALVQAMSTLPMFLFSLPAGALADIVDRRRLLIAVQIAAMAIAALFAIFVWLNWVTPNWLLTFIFLSGIATVLTMPAWQAIVPQLVPKEELRSAVALNGGGFNISRAVGPAMAGLAIGALGGAAPYWINALSTFAVIAALIWWRAPEPSAQSLPAEHFANAIRGGLRCARYNQDLRATLIRSAGFFPLASVYWALLPLLAREQIRGGPELYGVLLGAIGAGARYRRIRIACKGERRRRWYRFRGDGRNCARSCSIRRRRRVGNRAGCMCARGNFLDCRNRDFERIGAARVAVLGSRLRPSHLRNRAVRRLGNRKRRLGKSGAGDRSSGCSHHRGNRVGRAGPTAAALEASNR